MHLQSKADELLEIIMNEPAELLKSLAKKSNTTIAYVEDLWGKIKRDLIKQGIKESDPRFYKMLVGTLQKILKIK